jgi:hypothetical protein
MHSLDGIEEELLALLKNGGDTGDTGDKSQKPLRDSDLSVPTGQQQVSPPQPEWGLTQEATGDTETLAAQALSAFVPTVSSVPTNFGEGREAQDEIDERAAVIEHDGKVPRPLAEALARLDPSRAPCDVPDRRWLTFINDAGRFIDDGWVAKAEELGWSQLQLFGCCPIKPDARISRAGLLWTVNGRKVSALTADKATITAPDGHSLSSPKEIEPGGVLPWELQKKERQ